MTTTTRGPGTPIDEFVQQGKTNNAILQMHRRLEEINDYIDHLRKDGYQLQLSIHEDKFSCAILPPEGTEPI